MNSISPMGRRRRRLMPWRSALAIASVAALAADVVAQTSADADPQAWPEAETVRTLLRADAAAALADCRVPGICPAGAPAVAAATAPQSDDVRVAAIFGVARRLQVDLIVNGALLRYQAGRATPVAGAQVAQAYQLVAVDGGCVRLRRGDRDIRACLDAGSPAP
ncbi:hypothetical protein [Achromobacter sp. UMC71]|uniref:hypothetical protein n=1 Tax=Achromobacter sp. UMC71 TaxID=1862320 RepID=UPI0015FF378C|nr:hypothetical protein [Achromobacter sp. UMC71]